MTIEKLLQKVLNQQEGILKKGELILK